MSDIGFDTRIFLLIDEARENLTNDRAETNRILSRMSSIRQNKSAVVNRLNDRLTEMNRGDLKRRKRYEVGDSVTLTVLPTQRVKQRITVRQSKSKRNKFDESIGGYVSEHSEEIDVLKSPEYTDENASNFNYVRDGRKFIKPKGGYFSILRLDSTYRHRGDSSQVIKHTDKDGRSYDFARVIEHEGEYSFSILPNESTTPYILKQFFKWVRKPQVELVGAYVFDSWQFIHIDSDELFLTESVPDKSDFLRFFDRFDNHELVRLSDYVSDMSPLLAQYFQGFSSGYYYVKHSDGIGIYRDVVSIPGYLSKWFAEYPIAPRMTRVWKDKRKEQSKQRRDAGIKKNAKVGKIRSSYLLG